MKLFKKESLFRFNEDSLLYEKVSRFSMNKVILLIVLVIVLLSFSTVRCVYVTAEPKVDLLTNNTFSDKLLREEIKRLPLKHKDLIYAQCVLESNNFKSPVFKEGNNLVGFKEARQRITTAKGTHLNHAHYESWRDCLLDALIYQVKYTSELSRKDYLKYMGSVYAKDPEYENKLIKAAKQW